MIKVTVFNEFIHEQTENHPSAEVYPKGIHVAIKEFLESDEITVRTCTQDDEECGLTQEVLDDTDVLIWWSHIGREGVPDKVAARIYEAVTKGMGAIFLHSSHLSKPFLRLMGTSGYLGGWHESGVKERLWVVSPTHPIVQGLEKNYFEIPNEETYMEPFDIPTPDELIFIGWYASGEVLRSGCCYQRGRGKVFYFQPGHETFPIYYQPEIQTIIRNAVHWAKPVVRLKVLDGPNTQPLE